MKQKIITFALSWLETIAVIAFCILPVVVFLGCLFNGQFIAAIIGTFLSIIFNVVIFGGLFLMIQNNQALKDIRTLLQIKA